MFRSLSIQSPLQVGSWDDLLMYYHYQKSVRNSDLSPSVDPMLKFKTPTEVGMPSLSPENYEIFEWSLGGFSGLNPLQPQMPDFREWISSYIQYDYGNAPARFYGVVRQEPRLSINLPRFFEREKELTYRKILNNSAIQEYLNSIPVTAEILEDLLLGRLGDGSSPATRFLIEMRFRSTEITQFLEANSNDILGIYSLDNIEAVRDSNTLLELIAPSLSRYNETDSRDDAVPVSLVGGPLVSGLLQLLTMEQVLQLIFASPEYQNPTNNLQWSYYKTQQVTPFVNSAASREYLSETQVTDKRASLSADYNLYLRDYERSIATPGVQETYIPNGYAYYILNNSIPDPDTNDERIPPNLEISDAFPGIDPNLRVHERIRETAHNATTITENTLTLDGETTSESIQAQTPNRYYLEYAQNLATTTSITPQVTENIIFPATDSALLNTLKSRQNLFPFSVGIEFWRDSAENRSAEIVYQNLRSVSVLSGISGSVPVPSPVLVNTENLTRQNGSVTKGVVPSRTQGLNFYNFAEVMNFSAPPESEVVKPLVLTENCLEGATGFPSHPWFIPSQDSMLGQLTSYANSAAKTYSEIVELSVTDNNLDPESRTVSEAIGYRLAKRQLTLSEENTYQPGPVIQNIMFGNTPRMDNEQASSEAQITKYIDTQIKYGQNYGYSLYEYRLVYSTEYEFFMVAQDVPVGLAGNTAEAVRQSFNNINRQNQVPLINYRCYVLRRPKIELIEIPIYDRSTYINLDAGESEAYPLSGPGRLGSSFGLSYPPVRVLDTPPPPPDLTVLPLKGNSSQVKLIMSPSAGSYKGENALPIVYIPHDGTFYIDATRPMDLLQYQTEYASPPPQPRQLEGEPVRVLTLNYESEGVKEIKAIKVYRSTEINSQAASLARSYTSFDPVKNPETSRSLTLVNTLYAPDVEPDEENGEFGVVSFDMLDTIEPNVFYYYTCVAVDAHNNTSPPSPIYRVRLVLDKGLLVPEVDIYEHTPASLTTATKKFSRFIQVQASPVQVNPFSERNDEGQITSIRSLASERGQSSVTNNKFILRLTSKDTGRKFDMELDFYNKDTAIVPEEE